MNSFKKEKFKKVIDYKSGYTWSKEQELSRPNNGALRVLTITNVQKALDLSSELYLKNVSKKDRVNKTVSKEWTIAVSSNGNRKRIGNAIYIEKDTEFLFASFLTAFKPKPDTDILPKYFYYWFISHNIQERITSVSEGTTGLGNLDIRFLRNIDIEYPQDLNEQRKIASILTKVDDAIQAVKNTIEKAERLKKSLMQNLLTGKLKPDGSWRTDDEFYVDEKFGKVPIGWEVAPLNSKKVCKINPNYNFIKNEVYPFLPMEAVNDNFNGIIKYDFKIIDGGGYTRFKEGDVLLAKITPCAENGKSTYIEKLDAKIGFASTEFIVLSPKEKINGEFLYYRIINGDIYNLLISLMEGTTGRQRIPTNIFKNRVLISYPIMIEEQEKILSNIKYYHLLLSSKQQKIQKLERLKKALMQNLLTGKVRVKV